MVPAQVKLLLDVESGSDRPGGRFEHRQFRISRHVDNAAAVRFNPFPKDGTRGIKQR